MVRRTQYIVFILISFFSYFKSQAEETKIDSCVLFSRPFVEQTKKMVIKDMFSKLPPLKLKQDWYKPTEVRCSSMKGDAYIQWSIKVTDKAPMDVIDYFSDCLIQYQFTDTLEFERVKISCSYL